MVFSTLCRLCAVEQSEFVPVFNLYFGDTPASQFIMDVLHIEFDPDHEDLTTLIMCDTCNTALKDFYGFYMTVKEAQGKYNKQLEMEVDFEDNDNKLVDAFKEEPDSEYEDEDDDDYFNGDDSHQNESSMQNDEDDYIENDDNLNPDENKNVDDDVFESYESLDSNHEELESDSNKRNKKIKNKSRSKRVRKTEEKKVSDIVRMLQTKRSEKATSTMLSKYKLEEIWRADAWVLNQEQRDEMVLLYVDMKCRHCFIRPFPTYKDLLEHSLKEHNEEPGIRCCHSSYTTDIATMEIHILYKHLLKQKPPRRYKLIPCPVCKKVLRSSIMRNHLATHLPHEQREFHCEHCGQGFGTQGALNGHIKSNHLPLIPCDECGKMFKNRFVLKFHKNRVHNPKSDPHLCPECGKGFKNFSNFTKHVEAHNGVVERVKCHMCESVVTKTFLRFHMRTHDPEKLQQCPHCPYRAIRVGSHVKSVHEKVRPFACTFCPMTFFKEKSMKDHVASRHTNIPRYSCEFCERTFMSSGNYHSHRKKMHPALLQEKRLSEMKNKVISDIDPRTLTKKVKKIVQGEEAEMIKKNIENIKSKSQSH